MKRKIFLFFEKKLTESEKSDMFKRISESSKAKEEYIEIVNFLAYRQSIKPSLITEREEKTGTVRAGVFATVSLVLLFFMILGGIEFYRVQREKKAISQIVAIVQHRNNPVKASAILQLPEGDSISLHEVENSGDRLIKKARESATLLNAGNATDGTGGEMVENEDKFNSISVTGNRDYLLTLEDSTSVWIAPGSSFMFPDNFAEERRYVKLTGEAYFSVSKDIKRPFIIKTGDIEVKVLGTEFSLRSSVENNMLRLSMVSGKVALSGKDTPLIELGKNEQLNLNLSDGSYSIRKIDGYKYKAWTKGYFMFINESLPDIIHEISRRYGVEICLLSDKYDNQLFNGKFKADVGIDKLIRTFQLSYDFSFYMENNVLYIR